MSEKVPVTVAYGDGIGPEIMQAVLDILAAAEASIEVEEIKVGRQLYEQGYSAGIDEKAWESLKRTGVFLKAPIETTQGGGLKSLNVTVRKTLGLYSNVRPVTAFSPFVETNNPDMDLVIVRENEEDLYAGIEYQHTPLVAESVKLMRIIKLALMKVWV